MDHKYSKMCNFLDARFEVFMAIEIQVMVFWDATPCSDMIGY